MTAAPARLGFMPIGSSDNTRNRPFVRLLSPRLQTTAPEFERHLHTVYFRFTALKGGAYRDRKGDTGGTALLEAHLGWCQDRGIRVGVNLPTRYQCDGRQSLLVGIAEQAHRFRRLGFVWDDAQFQSAISGMVPSVGCREVYRKGGGADPESMRRRVQDVVDGTLAVLDVFPGARPIAADTAAAKDDEEHSADWDIARDYTWLAEGMAAAGLPVPVFHAAWEDTEARPDLADIKRFLDLCKANGWTSGLKPIGATYAGLVAFLARLWEAGVWPDELHLTSWARPWMTKVEPEAEDGTLAHVATTMSERGALVPRRAA